MLSCVGDGGALGEINAVKCEVCTFAEEIALGLLLFK